MNPKQAGQLREPFPPEAVGQLPKGGVLLDYVGHAATTDRLLQVDPDWTWEPFALDERGLPALDEDGNLWIRLTVAGVTRVGVGDGRNAKERIGDALRNAAMRFGVALDLWTKADLQQAKPVVTDEVWAEDFSTRTAYAETVGELREMWPELGVAVRDGKVAPADVATFRALLEGRAVDLEETASPTDLIPENAVRPKVKAAK